MSSTHPQRSVLSGEYLEGNTTNLRSANKVPHDDDWCGYSSDSDLEDDFSESVDVDYSDEAETTIDDASSNHSLDQIQNFSPNPFDLDTFLQSQLGDQLHASNIYHPAELTDENYDTLQDAESIKTEADQPLNHQSSTRSVHLGKVVVIKDAAFATLRALVMYLYTGKVEFAPFGSEENRKSRRREIHYTKMPETSPKSIYRLAEKCDIPDLKMLAYRHICANLSKCDIVEEYFSPFTSCYDEIRDAQAKYLAKILWAGSSPIDDILDKKIKSYANRELPHASESISTLFKILWNEDEVIGVEAASPLATPLSPCEPNLSMSNTLETALNLSITTGTFLDLCFYARPRYSSRMRPDSYRPIYCSRIVVNQWLDEIDGCTVKLDMASDDVTADEADSDFDDDDELSCKDSFAVGDIKETDMLTLTPRIPEDPSFDDGAMATYFFRVGAATTWKSLFFYTYTNDVAFAPLRSQGREIRVTGTETQHTSNAMNSTSKKKKKKTQHGLFPHQPKPCSPKSLYALAHKVGIDSLRDLAYKDIECKISASNIVIELFSRFTSSQPEILAMEDRILGENFRNSETGDTINEIIRTMSYEKVYYQSVALQSVFRRIIRHSKPLVDLRCSYRCYGVHGMSSLREGLYCPTHRSYPNCGSCGSGRSTNTRTCLNCGARFKD